MYDISADYEWRYHVWIARCEVNKRPAAWDQIPSGCTMVRSIGACESAEHAAAVIEGFNREMIAMEGRLWAVVVPLRIGHEGKLLGRHQKVLDLSSR